MTFEWVVFINKWLSNKIIKLLLDYIVKQSDEIIRMRAGINQLIVDTPNITSISVVGMKPNKSSIERLEDILYNRGD